MWQRIVSLWRRWMRRLTEDAKERGEDTLDRAALRENLIKPFYQYTFRQFWRYFLPPFRITATGVLYAPLRRLGLPWSLAALLTFAASGWLLSALLFLFYYSPEFVVGEPAARTALTFSVWGVLMVIEEAILQRTFGHIEPVDRAEVWPVVKNSVYLLVGFLALML